MWIQNKVITNGRSSLSQNIHALVSFAVDVVDVSFLKKLEEWPAIRYQSIIRVRRVRYTMVVRIVITTLASSSMYSFFFMFKSFAKVRPSRRPYSSTAIEWVIPIFLEKAPIQEPVWSPISPPTLALPDVEDKFFTPHGFISLATHTMSMLAWILEKSLLKPKRVHIHKMTLKPMVQNSWRYNLINAHSSSSWHNISFSAHESHQGNFGSRGLEDQDVQ